MNSNIVFSNPGGQAVFLILLCIYWISEIVIGSRLRANANDKTDDRGSIRVLFVVMFGSGLLAWSCVFIFPAAAFGGVIAFSVGIGFMLVGQLLRWWSIATLGRFFTVNVAIRTAHRLIDSGPYRLIRHPSYTAMLLVYLGVVLCMGNALSVAIFMVSSFLALLYRIRVEEDVLVMGLGDAYRNYVSRTKRLVPGVY